MSDEKIAALGRKKLGILFLLRDLEDELKASTPEEKDEIFSILRDVRDESIAVLSNPEYCGEFSEDY